MSNKKKHRQELINAINEEGRKMSTVTVIFHQAIAEKASLSGADHKYLDLLFQEGEMTAGRLAELTGLTTGAVTGIIDRLEKQNLVKRQRDPNDRRKVIVVVQVENAMKRLVPVFESLQADLAAFYDKYSDQDLEVIREYIMDSNEFFQQKTRQLRKDER